MTPSLLHLINLNASIWLLLLLLFLSSSGNGTTTNAFLLGLQNSVLRQQIVVLLSSSSSSSEDGANSKNKNNNNNNQLEVAILLPSSATSFIVSDDDSKDEDDVLQMSANEIVSKLRLLPTCKEANVVVCNTPQADDICQKRMPNVLIALGVESPFDVRFVATAFRLRRTAAPTDKPICQFALGGKPFAPLVDKWDEANPTWEKDLPWTATAKDRKLLIQMQTLFDKGEIDDYVQAIELFLTKKAAA